MRYLKYVLIVTILFLLVPQVSEAKEKQTLYFFHSETCIHCKKAKEWFPEVKKKYKDLEIVSYEISENEDNAELFLKVIEELNVKSKAVPFFVIGNKYLTGFSELQKDSIIRNIKYYNNNSEKYEDIIRPIIDGNKLEIKPINIADEEKEFALKQIAKIGSLIILLIIFYIWFNKYTKKANTFKK